MKIIKTAAGNSIKISRKEWESIGKKAGWIKEALFDQKQSNEIIRGVKVEKDGLGPYAQFVVKAFTDIGTMDNLIELDSSLFDSPLYRGRLKRMTDSLVGKTVGEAMTILDDIRHNIDTMHEDMAGLSRH